MSLLLLVAAAAGQLTSQDCQALVFSATPYFNTTSGLCEPQRECAWDQTFDQAANECQQIPTSQLPVIEHIKFESASAEAQ